MRDVDSAGVDRAARDAAGSQGDMPAGSGSGGAPSAAHPLRLEVVAGKASGLSILIDEDLVIGRHAEGAGRLAEDDEISRLHARITRAAADRWTIEDLGSTNGTLVNGSRIAEPVTLADRDEIQVGETLLVVRDLPLTPLDEQAPSPAAAQPTTIGRVSPAETTTPELSDAEPETATLERSEAEPDTTTPELAEAEPETATRTAIAVKIEIDFAASSAQVVMDDAGTPLRLVFEGGMWHVAPPSD
jgi:pSer/pThr/pTyr-binding forkhead associated (FHA) protein